MFFVFFDKCMSNKRLKLKITEPKEVFDKRKLKKDKIIDWQILKSSFWQNKCQKHVIIDDNLFSNSKTANAIYWKNFLVIDLDLFTNQNLVLYTQFLLFFSASLQILVKLFGLSKLFLYYTSSILHYLTILWCNNALSFNVCNING